MSDQFMLSLNKKILEIEFNVKQEYLQCCLSGFKKDDIAKSEQLIHLLIKSMLNTIAQYKEELFSQDEEKIYSKMLDETILK